MMKRICLVIHALGIGGMERVMSQLAINFSQRQGALVDIILIGKNRNVVYSMPDEIAIHRPPFEFNNSRRILGTVKTMLFLRKKVKELNPDTVLSFGEYWNNLVLLSLVGLTYPVFISDRSEPDKDLGMVQNVLRNRLYPFASGYIAQTAAARDVCIAKGWNTNIQVIGNPIRQIRVGDWSEKERVILSVGRLIKTKHFDQLIRMFAEIIDSKWKLVIVGGDAKKQKLSKGLEEVIRSLGIEDRVVLAGRQVDINPYYHRSSIFAFTSSSEGFPNVIGEAMSAGLPVVAYDCVAGPSDMIVDGKNGFLVPLFDRVEFKKRLKQLMNDADLRKEMGHVGREQIQKYQVDRISDQFYAFITNSPASITTNVEVLDENTY